MTRILPALVALALCLSLAGAPQTAPAMAVEADPDCLAAVAGVDLQRATVLDLQAALDDGRLTSRSLVSAYLDRIEAFDRSGPELNAVREIHPNVVAQAARLDAERRAGKVRGPLHGIPVLLKDNVGTDDMPTTAGSIALEGSIPLRDAHVTAQLREAGAIILGKANLSEFANWVDLSMPSGYSSLGGQVINPYAFSDTPSGSSSGSGVAGTMAFAAATVGTETSGSILSPSEANSLVGVKPTVGLVSRAGIIPLAPSYDTAGPMVRTVTDAAAMLDAMAGADPRDPITSGSNGKIPAEGYLAALDDTALEGVRLGIESVPSGERGAVIQAALDDLESQGAEIVQIENFDDAKSVGLAEIATIPNEFKESLNRYLAEETAADLRVKTLGEIIEFNKAHPDKVKYGQKLLEASNLTLGMRDEPTAIASRTAAIQASRAAIDATLLRYDLDAILSTGAGNANVGAAAGYPTVAVPAGYTNAGTRPVNLAFLGTAYAEPALLGYAYDYEQATHRRVPPTAANSDLFPIDCAA